MLGRGRGTRGRDAHMETRLGVADRPEDAGLTDPATQVFAEEMTMGSSEPKLRRFRLLGAQPSAPTPTDRRSSPAPVVNGTDPEGLAVGNLTAVSISPNSNTNRSGALVQIFFG